MQLKFSNAINNQRLPLHIAKMEAKENRNHYYPVVSRVYQGARMSLKESTHQFPGHSGIYIERTDTWQDIDLQNGEFFKDECCWHLQRVKSHDIITECPPVSSLPSVTPHWDRPGSLITFIRASDCQRDLLCIYTSKEEKLGKSPSHTLFNMKSSPWRASWQTKVPLK